MASNSDWTDRRGLAHKGRELHNPATPGGRKFSETGVTQAVRRASTSSKEGEDKSAASSFPTASGRRRSSAASGGMFGKLDQMKRGSQDYGERRASQQEMTGSGGGLLSGWFNQTFKGAAKSSGSGEQK